MLLLGLRCFYPVWGASTRSEVLLPVYMGSRPYILLGAFTHTPRGRARVSPGRYTKHALLVRMPYLFAVEPFPSRGFALGAILCLICAFFVHESNAVIRTKPPKPGFEAT